MEATIFDTAEHMSMSREERGSVESPSKERMIDRVVSNKRQLTGKDLELFVKRKLDRYMQNAKQTRQQTAIECGRPFRPPYCQCSVEGMPIADFIPCLRLQYE